MLMVLLMYFDKIFAIVAVLSATALIGIVPTNFGGMASADSGGGGGFSNGKGGCGGGGFDGFGGGGCSTNANGNSGGSNSQRNDACYNAGYTDGRGHPYNQTNYKNCGIDGRAYYEGFLSGCISGQGKDYFSCQKMTNAPTDADADDGGGVRGNSANGGGGGVD
jgi:hypothetical protein